MFERRYRVVVGGVTDNLTGSDHISFQASQARIMGLKNNSGFSVATKPHMPGWRDPERLAKVRLGSKQKPHGKPGENTPGGVSYWPQKQLDKLYHRDVTQRIIAAEFEF